MSAMNLVVRAAFAVALIAVSAPENTRDGSDIAPDRTGAVQRAWSGSSSAWP